MNKYLVVVAQIHSDGVVAPTVSTYDDESSALYTYYNELAYALVSDQIVKDSVFVLGTDGSVLYNHTVNGKATLASS